jgi:hypothetical protein
MQKFILACLMACVPSAVMAHPSCSSEPTCEIENRCIQALSPCAETDISRIGYLAKLKINMVCVTPGGVVARFSKQEVQRSDNFMDFRVSNAESLSICNVNRKEFLRLNDRCK